MNFISVPAGTTLMTVIFSVRVTKPNDDTDKNGTKIHIVSQLDPWNLFQLSSGIRVF